MPQPTRMGPAQTKAGTAIVKSGGGMLGRAIDVSEIKDDNLKFCIYGENRSGKTTLACQFEKPLLLLAFEPNETGGALSVRKMKGVKYLRIREVDELDAVTEELKSDGYYRSVVTDSATSLQDVVLSKVMNLEKAPEMLQFGLVSMDQYRERSELTREKLRPILNLKKHIVVTAKQRDHNRQDKSKPKLLGMRELESFFAADLGGATAGWLNDNCDYICRLFVDMEVKKIKKTFTNTVTKVVTTKIEEVETGNVIRKLQTILLPNYAGGFRSADPDVVPPFIERPTYEKILSVVRGIKLKEE